MKKLYFTIFISLLFISSCKLTPTEDDYINVPDDYSTIQKTIDASVDGDTILVEPGTYYENINFNGKNITLASNYILDNDERYISNTIIDGSSNGRVVTFENGETKNAKLTGFTIQNGKAEWIEEETDLWKSHGGGILCYESHPTLSYLNVINNKAHTGAGTAFHKSNSRIDNITIEDNACIANYFGADGDVYAIYDNESNLFINKANIINHSGTLTKVVHSYSDSITFYNSTISFNQSVTHGIYSSGRVILENVSIINNIPPDWASPNGLGVGLSGSTMSITNCLIANNGRTGISTGSNIIEDNKSSVITNTTVAGHKFGISLYGGNTIIHNSIFKNQIAFEIYSIRLAWGVYIPAILLLHYSNMFNFENGNIGNEEPKSVVSLLSSSISSNPMFVDPVNGDFHLQPGSPCIDAGDPQGQYYDTDYSRNDMGAYGGPGGDW